MKSDEKFEKQINDAEKFNDEFINRLNSEENRNLLIEYIELSLRELNIEQLYRLAKIAIRFKAGLEH